MSTEVESGSEKKRKPLLQKYEVPISHLDFSYIKECVNVLEVERIIKILRSNEEGSYPELLKCAEERLKVLKPESKLLRLIEPVLTKKQIHPDEWKSIEEDLLNWKEEVENIENRLSSVKDVPTPSNMYPQIRRPVDKMISADESKIDQKGSSKQIKLTDYKKWDMYDADSECLKLDLEEEKRNEEKKRKELEEKRKMEIDSQLSLEEKEIQLISGTADGLSPEERKILAAKEKDLGNEFYQTNRLDQALRHYTRSIYLHPTAVAHNNRAATYLKQCRFSKALDDLNIVLEMEPNNVKAHFRRAMCLQHKNEFHKALDDILEVLKFEPNHVLASYVADQLRENCASLPRKHRVKIRDDKNPSRVIVKEVTEEELKRDYRDKDYIEVNHLGLPTIMCNCNGKYTNYPFLKSDDPIRFQHIRERYGEQSLEKIAELERSGTTSKRVKPMSVQTQDDPSMSSAIVKRNKPLIEPANPGQQGSGVLFGGAKRLEIVELEKIEEEEHSPNKQPFVSKTLAMEKNEFTNTLTNTKASTTCLISDMRANKPKKVFFGGYIEEEEEGNPPVSKTLKSEPESNTNLLHKENEEKTNTNMELKEGDRRDMCDFRVAGIGAGAGDLPSSYVPGIMATELNTDMALTSWDASHLYPQRWKAFKTSPQSPLSNSSVNDEFSSDIDSDDDEFPEDESSTDQIVDMQQVEKLIDNDVDTISKDLFPQDNLVKCSCGEGYRLKQFQFESKWSELENSVNPLESRGRLIRLVCPHHQLPTVIGSNLTEQLLAGFIACLNYHFDPVTEREKIFSYLQAISNLPRFKIIAKFLTLEDKTVAQDLLKKLHPIANNIEEAFS